jgi:hypothetical protein
MSALAFVLWTAVAAAPPSGDLTFEQTATTTVDGKAGPAVRSRVYWSGRKVRLESGDAFEPLVMLIDLEHDRAYRLDAASRTAVRLDVDSLRARAHMGFAMAGDSIGAGEDSLRGQTLPGTRAIAGYKCTGHRLRAGETRIDVWLTKGVAVDMDAFAELLDWSGASSAMGGLLPALRELGGFPMETRSRVTADRRVYETRAAVTSLDQKKLPPALFEVPSSFTVEDEDTADPAP